MERVGEKTSLIINRYGCVSKAALTVQKIKYTISHSSMLDGIRLKK